MFFRVFLGFFGFTLIPMLISLYYSFTDFDLLTPESWVGASNFVKMMADKKFLASLGVTLPQVSAALKEGNVAEPSGRITLGEKETFFRMTGAPGIDASSGVESVPGVKDLGLMEAFFEAARNAERESAVAGRGK